MNDRSTGSDAFSQLQRLQIGQSQPFETEIRRRAYSGRYPTRTAYLKTNELRSTVSANSVLGSYNRGKPLTTEAGRCTHEIGHPVCLGILPDLREGESRRSDGLRQGLRLRVVVLQRRRHFAVVVNVFDLVRHCDGKGSCTGASQLQKLTDGKERGGQWRGINRWKGFYRRVDKYMFDATRPG